MSESRKSKPIWRYIVFAIILAFCFQFAASNWDEFTAIRFTNPYSLIVVLLVVSASVAVSALQSMSFFRIFSVHLTFAESLGLTTINAAGNLIGPARGGTISNAVYLKKVHKLSFGTYVGSLAATYFVSFAVNSGLGLWSLLSVSIDSAEVRVARAILIAVFVASIAAILVFPKTRWQTTNSALGFIINAINACSVLRSHPRELFLQLLCVSLNSLCLFFIIHFSLTAIGMTAQPYQVMFIGIVASLSSVISITPGNLGVREIFSVTSATVVSIGSAPIIVASVVERAAFFVVAIFFAGIFGHDLARRFRGDAPSTAREGAAL